MPTFKCKKCNKKFDAQSKLEKHLQRKYPCDKKLEYTCNRCNKSFNKKYNYEKHLNRKYPCENSNQVSSAIEQEKIALEREKIKLKEKQMEHEMEKLKLKEKQMEHEIEKLKLKNESKEAEREKEIEIQKLKNEKVQLQKEKNIELENKKTERKERTAIVINKDNVINNINNVTNNINNTYMYNFNIDDEKKEKFKKRILDSIDAKYAKEAIYKAEGINDMISFCIAFTFNNDNYPELKYFKYDQENKLYFRAINNEFKHIDFEDIEPELRVAFDKTCKKMLSLAPEPKFMDNEKNYGNYAEIRNCTYKGMYNMKNAAGIGLLEENKIRDDED